MLNIIYTEVLKLKRNKILWLLPIGGILPSLLNVMIIINNLNDSRYNWEGFLKNNIVFMSLIMAVALFSLISGYIFSREYTENMVNSLYTYPVAKYKFVFAKLIVMFMIIYATLAINLGFLLAGGMLLIKESLEASLFIKSIKDQLWMGIMFFALSPVGAVLGVMGKNVIPPIVLGISAVITNVVVVNSKYIDVFPWSIPAAYIFRAETKEPQLVCLKAVIILTAIFILSLGALIVYIKKTDVYAGS